MKERSTEKKLFLQPWVPRLIEVTYWWLINHATLLIALVAGASLLSMLLLRLHLITAYIPELGGIESNVIYSLQRILDGYPLYVDPATPPYSITQYTPLYYYLCLLVGRVAGVDPDNVHHVYMLSRSVSLLLNVLFSFSVYTILRKIFQVKMPLSALAFSYAFIYLDEESFSRPDSLFNFFALLAIGLFLKLLTKEGLKRPQFYLIGASVVSVVAIFAKQSAIYLPLLLLFYLVCFLQNFRWTVVALLTMGFTFGLLFMLSGQGDTHAFLQNTVQGVNNGISTSWFAKRIMIEHFQKERFLNILGLFTGIFFLAQGRNHALRFLGLSILVSFTFALVTSVKIGAAPNYFTEFIALTIIATMVFIATHAPPVRGSSSAEKTKEIWVCAPLFYLLLVAFTLPPRFAGKYVRKVVVVHELGQQGYLANRAVADFLYREEHLLPDEQVFVTTHVHDYLNKFFYRNVVFPQKEIVAANPPHSYDYISFTHATETGQVAYVIASLSEGHVDTVGQRHSINFSFIETDFSAYVPIKQLGDYVVFEHQSKIPQKSETKQ